MISDQLIGQRLKEARESAGKTQAEVCEALTQLGVSMQPPTLSSMENGNKKARPNLDRVRAIAKVLGVPVPQLLAEPGDQALVVEAVSRPGLAQDLVLAYLKGGVRGVIQWMATAVDQFSE